MKLPHLAAALLVALAAGGALPPPATAAPLEGEVIVQFKPQAALTRRFALAARAQPAAVSQVLTERATALGARLGRTLQAGAAVGERSQVLRADGISAAELAALLAADPEVEFAVPNGRKRRSTAPNDPLYPATTANPRSNGVALQNGPLSGQWYLRAPAADVSSGPVSAIDIEAAWTHTRGRADVVVAVLDTGVRTEHPDLAGRLLPGYDFVADAAVANDGGGRDADPSDPGDWTTAVENNATGGKFFGCGPLDPATGKHLAEASSWHGSSTSALVGASTDNAIGMAGAAPGVALLPLRVLGKCFGNDSDIQAAMRWAVGMNVPGVPNNPNPAKVLNLSLGGDGSCDAGYQSVVDEVLAAGAVVVAAAGNSAGGPVGVPANCNGVIAVLALRHAGSKVGFSDLGPQIAIAAPGGNCINVSAGSPCLFPMLSATNTGLQGPVASAWSDSFNAAVGTSFSAPLVAATAGLMFSAQPALTPALLRSRMQATARPFPTTGADNGDGSVVPQCQAPATGVEQLQCYCNTSYCGAGMLDAGAAVSAVSATVARIAVTTLSPTAGSAVTLSAAGSVIGGGATLASTSWALVDGGGIVTAFDSATNASTATLTPSAAGSFTVSVTVTDSLGHSDEARQTVSVTAAPAPPPVTTGGGGSSGGGGGATSWPWLAALALAVAALFRAGPVSRRA